MRYYEQSPEHRDPALFAANFSTFWGRTVDEIWTEIHDHPVNQAFIGDTKICPCSLPPLAADGAVVNDRARAPYWTLPPLAGQTLALTAGVGDAVVVQDCAGVQLALRNQGVLARFDDTTAPRYVLPRLATATIGHYLSDDCAAAAPYTIGPAFRSSANLGVAVSQPASEAATVYVQLTTASPWTLRGGLNAICDSCSFDPGMCPPLSAGAPQTVQGTFYGRIQVYKSVLNPNADAVVTSISINP